MEFKKALTNKDRLCERSEPRSYPVVGQARPFIWKYIFLEKLREAYPSGMRYLQDAAMYLPEQVKKTTLS
jgi:hypothetical protein